MTTKWSAIRAAKGAPPATADDRARFRRSLPRRHPAEVTADRLGNHLDRWYDKTDGPMRDAIAKVRDWLDQRAQEDGSGW